ncbi:hypothetical protein N7468_001864 [Penicillium chermesinum]|uniref:Uncharacterized protein n=1 Tax=Penicillium chermesinum TaxID=63820 RepID=A0A9W9PJ49_9EURO|nr:uncharacterized protein N7468_001864 [Penicillium chermesinum]KAJ5246881.1 hypothetical protein N7468_001864 [Penicillium chermesinum]
MASARSSTPYLHMKLKSGIVSRYDAVGPAVANAWYMQGANNGNKIGLLANIRAAIALLVYPPYVSMMYEKLQGAYMGSDIQEGLELGLNCRSGPIQLHQPATLPFPRMI